MAQVLHGVAPGRARESREGRALGGVREQLQRLLVEAEAQALQRELGGIDEEESRGQQERLRGQLAKQHARIVELEALAEAGAHAQAAQQEAALLREQLQQLTRQKLQLVSADEGADEGAARGAGAPPVVSLCTRPAKVRRGPDHHLLRLHPLPIGLAQPRPPLTVARTPAVWSARISTDLLATPTPAAMVGRPPLEL
jgi:hypothetical protein